MRLLIYLLLSIALVLLTACDASITGNAVEYVDVCREGIDCSGDDKTSKANIDDGFVNIPLSSISDKMTKFDYGSDGVMVSYFVVIGSDGEIRTAFDACDVCGGHQGYRQQGQDVVCNNCGRFFDIDDIGTKNLGGGCWPSYLDHRIEGDNILISKSELDKGAYRFA